jgi:hypothetical protein
MAARASEGSTVNIRFFLCDGTTEVERAQPGETAASRMHQIRTSGEIHTVINDKTRLTADILDATDEKATEGQTNMEGI